MVKDKTFLAINVSVFLIMIGVGLIVALLPRQLMNLSASVSDVGLLASVFAIPYVLLQIPVGRLADIVGFKHLMAAGYLFCALTGILYFYSNTPNMVLGGRFLQGLAEVPIWTLGPALLSIRYANQKGKSMGIYNASLHCGLTLGGLISVFAYRFMEGNQPFLVFTLLGLTGSVLVLLFVENPANKSVAGNEASKKVSFKTLLSDPVNLLVNCGVTFYGAGYGLFITIVPAFLILEKGAEQSTIGVFFALFYIAISISQLFAGNWSDKRGRKPAMIIGLAAAAAGILLFHGFNSIPAILFLSLASLGLGVFSVSSLAFLNERVSQSQKGSISGVYYFFFGLGYFSGPLILGKAGEGFGFGAAFMLFAAVIAILMVILGFAIRPGQPLQSSKVFNS